MKTNQIIRECAPGSVAPCITGEQQLRKIYADCIRDDVVSRFFRTIRIPHRLKMKIWRMERKFLVRENRGKISCRAGEPVF